MLPGVQQALEDRNVKKLIDWYHSQFDSIVADAKKALLTLDVEELVAAFLHLKHGGRRDAHLLAERDAPRAAELLTEAMRDGEAVAIRLLAGLVEADTRDSTASSARSVLQELVHSENRAGKITLAGALQPTSPAGLALLHALSIDPDAAVRIAVANRISEALSQPGMEVLQSLLADTDADVRLAAVHAVKSPKMFPDNRAIPEEARARELMRALLDTDARVREAAATLLGNIYGEFQGRDDAIRAISVSASDEDQPVQVASIVALARLGGSVAASALVDLLVQDADARGVAARAILNLPSGDGASDLVLAGLKHADADVRLAMTEAIANDAGGAKWAGSHRWLDGAGPLLSAATTSGVLVDDELQPIVMRLWELRFESDVRIQQSAARALSAINALLTKRVRDAIEKVREEESRMDCLIPGAGGRSTTPTDDVRFTVYHPTTLALDQSRKLLVYLHVAGAGWQVARDSQVRLVETPGKFWRGAGDALTPIQKGTTVRIVPRLPHTRFSPGYSDVEWVGDCHLAEFHMESHWSNAINPGQIVDGVVQFFVGPLLIGDVNLWAVACPTGLGMEVRDTPLNATSSSEMYAAIFPCYAREDSSFVDKLEQAYSLLNLRYLRDVRMLLAGDNWKPRLRELIGEADVFQLCWSSAAAKSMEVRSEWEYALDLRRDGFIRPIYWEVPMPAAPSELEHLHFRQWYLT